MRTNLSAHIRKVFLGIILVGFALLLGHGGSGSPTARARMVAAPQPGAYATLNILPEMPQTDAYNPAATLSLSDEASFKRHTIIDPVIPPSSVGMEQSVALPKSRSTKARVPGPVYENSCGAVSGVINATILDNGVYDCGCPSQSVPGMEAGSDARSCPLEPVVWVQPQNTYSDLYAGPTNGGVMPLLENSSWPTWTDVVGDTYSNNPLIASHLGVDGRTNRGTIDDYWVSYESTAPDPYITNGWAQHTWGDALGDYMYSSQSAFSNIDGATSFFTYDNLADPYTCEVMSSNSRPDGTLGIKQFYQARGYAVGDCYNQLTDNTIAGGFSFAQFKAEIDAGWPVLLGLNGHSVVGIGYNASLNRVYLYNGWDNDIHAMEWKNSCVTSGCSVSYKYPDTPPYDYDLPLQFASVVRIVPGVPNFYTISGNVGVADATITYTGGFTTSDGSGNYSFQVSESWFGTVTPSKTGQTFNPSSKFYKNVATDYPDQNYNGLNLIQDPGFEPGSSNPWTEYTSGSYMHLCTVADCGTGYNTAPRTGSAWGWLGGPSGENESASLSQTITIPSGASATLKFYFWIGYAEMGSDINDKFTVTIDSTPVFSANATHIDSYPDYTLVSLDVSAYANGLSHTIAFSSETTDQQVDFNVDDISLTGTSTIFGNAGVGGATLSYTDSDPKTVTANGSGIYSITVPFFWSGTVTPSKAGYTFDPVNRVYENLPGSQAAQNYAATPITPAISGNAGTAGATITYTGGSTTTDNNGNYSFTVPYAWSGTVTPSKAGYLFDPASRSYANVTSEKAGENYTSDGLPTDISLSSSSIAENQPLATTIGTFTTTDPDTGDTFTYSLVDNPTHPDNAAFQINGAALKTNAIFDYETRAAYTLKVQTSDGHGGALAKEFTISVTDVYDPAITISGNAGIGGAILSYIDGTSKTAAADTNGNYSITVPYSWSGTVTPARANYAFSPEFRAYTNITSGLSGEDYTAMPIPYTATTYSTSAHDGWILESSETSKKGGSLDAKAPTLRLGDDNLKKQYLGILSFSTAADLPDDAVIIQVTLKVKKQGVTGGGNPLKTFQGFMVDIKKGFFGATALQTGDFQAKPSKTYGPFKPALSGGWYSIDLTAGKDYINKLSTVSGLTQIRLRFKLDDNNNAVANYLSLYSGNAPIAFRPQLIIEYYLP